jgi:hypothetical protein
VRKPADDDPDQSRVIWLCLEPSALGMRITVHCEDPGEETPLVGGLAAVHVESWGDQLAVQLSPGEHGPGEDALWPRLWGVEAVEIDAHDPDGASILLVPSVRD